MKPKSLQFFIFGILIKEKMASVRVIYRGEVKKKGKKREFPDPGKKGNQV